MLADVRSQAFVANFAGQWLYLRDLLAVKRPDDRLFPDFDEGLRRAMATETELFFAAMVRENRSVFDLLRADFTFLNERLAQHYGIPNVYGSQFRRVTLPADSPRRGLLGQGSILTVTSYANRTSPGQSRQVHPRDACSRCRRRRRRPTCRRSGTPTTKGRVFSMRDRMEQHRTNPSCASCHAQMDPLGFALENFDADRAVAHAAVKSHDADRQLGGAPGRDGDRRASSGCVRCCLRPPLDPEFVRHRHREDAQRTRSVAALKPSDRAVHPRDHA